MGTTRTKAKPKAKPKKKQAAKLQASGPLKLNIGGGRTEIDGYINVDRKFGMEAYPLAYGDNTVAEIRASHVLEHIEFAKIKDVLKDWYRALMPGGMIRIAVPDFEWLAKAYTDNTGFPVQPFIMGSQSDANDYHKALFDYGALEELLFNAGFRRFQRWKNPDGFVDCASYECSLNLEAQKPVVEGIENVTDVYGCVSIARYSASIFTIKLVNAIQKVPMYVDVISGCFWHKNITNSMEKGLKTGARYILTFDGDTIFQPDDIVELYRLMEAYPDMDAICAVQSKRGASVALFGMDPENGTSVPAAMFSGPRTQINTGHFGLTMFRAESLQSQPRPWMQAVSGHDGTYAEAANAIDPDINFWHNWKAQGKSLWLANRVRIGHVEEMFAWSNNQFETFHQYPMDYERNGAPV